MVRELVYQKGNGYALMICRVTIEKSARFAGGHEFPVTGAYEIFVGKAFGQIDPRAANNKVIINLEKAPKNQNGKVDYRTDLVILKPVDIKRGNKKFVFEPPNRGSKRILMYLNDAPENEDLDSIADAGNAFLMKQGYTIVWCGWQGDLLADNGLLTMEVPVATNGGDEIVGRVRTEIVINKAGIYSSPLSNDTKVISYETATLDKTKARLTVRKKSYGRRIPIPNEEWEFARYYKDESAGASEIKQDTRHIYLRSGFKPGYIYEFIYLAKNPLVLGIGFAAVRDTISFLRYELRDTEGNKNPLITERGHLIIQRAYAWGRSQSGRFLRDFVYHGFNEAESGRRVFDAVFSHATGAGRVFLNYEFARPVTSSFQHTNQLDPELFPFAYNVLKDPQSGKLDGILKRPKTDPYVIHTHTSTEYWQKRGCLVHTDGKGKDIPIPSKVRIYSIASTQHNTAFGSVPNRVGSQQLTNPIAVGDVLRALMVAMDRWVSEGTPPPSNRIPLASDGTLVPANRKSTGFPKIPGVRYAGLYNRQLFLNYGRKLMRGKIDFHPPKQLKKGAYAILVPKVDIDGNDLAGIRLPAITVPLATYTGWNLQTQDLAEDELCTMLGSYIPFLKTIGERKSCRDPRLSIEERYGGVSDYVRKVSHAARAMIDERFLLGKDADRIIAEARKCVVFRVVGS